MPKPKSVVFAINSYLWKVLEANLGWSRTDYPSQFTASGLVPIIPASQEPEFLQYNKPFVMYGSAIDSFGTTPFVTSETVAYTVNAVTATEADNVMRTISEAFKGMDESAVNVNEWLRVEGKNRGISFRTIEVLQATSSGPPTQEGGRVDSQVVIRVRYLDFSEVQVNGFTL